MSFEQSPGKPEAKVVKRSLRIKFGELGAKLTRFMQGPESSESMELNRLNEAGYTRMTIIDPYIDPSNPDAKPVTRWVKGIQEHGNGPEDSSEEDSQA
jgi:hypothetical protein